jgi:uncharacterized protein
MSAPEYGRMSDITPPFWTTKSLDEMSAPEWESLCDGCGRCCLLKLEDADTGRIYATDIGCTLFDTQTCQCSDYSNRAARVPDCVTLTPAEVRTLSWLPPSCAYRLVEEGRGLMWWHPLISGTQQTVIEAGISVKGRVAGLEDDYSADDVEDRIANWPMKWPKAARKPA